MDDPRNIFYNNRMEQPKTEAHQEQKTTTNTQGVDVKKLQQLADKYTKEGENKLVSDIISNVIAQKANGTLSNEQLLAFYKRVTPFMNADQRARLDGLMQELLKV